MAFGTGVVGISTGADSPPRWRGEVLALDRFSAKVALETRETALRDGANVWLHFDPPGGGAPLSVAGIVSGVAPGGRLTVLLSLSPREYNRLQGLPDPGVQRSRRAVQPSSLTPPGIKPLQKPATPEPRPEPASPPPAEPAEALSAGEPDLASLSPIDRAKALAAALAEMIGPSAESAPPRPSEPAPPPGRVEPPLEPVSPSPVEPVEVPAPVEPSVEPEWLRPVEAAEVPVEEPPPEPARESRVEPSGMAAPPPEPVSPSPVEAAEAPVETVGPPPEPVGPSPLEPVEAPPPAVKPSVVRMSFIARAKALAAALGEMVGPGAEPALPRPGERGEAPVEVVEPRPEPVGLSSVAPEPEEAPVETVEPSSEPASSSLVAPAAPMEPSGELAWLGPVEAAAVPAEAVEPPSEPAWLRPADEVEVPGEVVEIAPEPVSVSPAEQAEALAARGDHEGAWKVYYDALRVAPEDLRLWHGLGLTLSRLNRRKEAEEIFRYVVSRGDPDSEEMKHALHWLVETASLAEPAATAVPAAPQAEPEPSAIITGKVSWREPEPPREAFLVLQGLDKDAPRLHARVRLGESYEFDRLPPGSYHLIGGVENDWLWDVRCTVRAGQEMVLDLSRQNSTNPKARI